MGAACIKPTGAALLRLICRKTGAAAKQQGLATDSDQNSPQPIGATKPPDRRKRLVQAALLEFLRGTPDWIRTSDLQSRSLTLYPTELRARVGAMAVEAIPEQKNHRMRWFSWQATRPSPLLQAELFVKAIHATAGVHQLLLTGVERMALGADFNLDIATGGGGLDHLATCATDRGGLVLRMNSLFH